MQIEEPVRIIKCYFKIQHIQPYQHSFFFFLFRGRVTAVPRAGDGLMDAQPSVISGGESLHIASTETHL